MYKHCNKPIIRTFRTWITSVTVIHFFIIRFPSLYHEYMSWHTLEMEWDLMIR